MNSTQPPPKGVRNTESGGREVGIDRRIWTGALAHHTKFHKEIEW